MAEAGVRGRAVSSCAEAARRAALLAGMPGSRKGCDREKVGLGGEEEVGAVLQGSVRGSGHLRGNPFRELLVDSNWTPLPAKVVKI